MASAAPVLASMLASKVVGHVGEKQGWDPRFTAIASVVAGAGAGSLGSGIAAANASTAASKLPLMASNAPDIMFKTPPAFAMKPVMGPSVADVGSRFAAGASVNSFGPDVPWGGNPISTKYLPPMDGVAYQHPGTTVLQGTKDAWNAKWKDQKFITSLGSTFIDGMFQKPEPVQHQGGGGGGGGGGGSPGPYQGGASTPPKFIDMYPKVMSPEWREIG